MTQMSIRTDFGRHAPLEADPVQSERLGPALNDYQARSRAADVLAIRRSLRARGQRGRFFNPRLFADPAWDMLLELYAAALIQRRLPISRLAERSAVPMTTALRWIATLEGEGLIERQDDRLDRRRVFITLSIKGETAMDAYFDALAGDTMPL